MPLNIPGLLAPFQLIFYPRLALPHISVKDIRQLDFQALRRGGYRGAVFDKDNCLTIPHKDQLVPELKDAWDECKETFGAGNVLIVSNSAGTYLDSGGIQSESVSHYLGVPVLFHKSFKPAYSCISNIHTYFSSLPAPVKPNELIIVGDRVFTDVIIANRIRLQEANKQNKKGFLRSVLECGYEKDGTVDTEKETLMKEGAVVDGARQGPAGPIAIWTTGVWQRESMLMRWVERGLVNAARNWSKPRHWDCKDRNMERFIKKKVEIELPKKKGALETVMEKLAMRRA